MEFRYFDRMNSEMTIAEVETLAIWNPTMEHIFARTIERVEQENITGKQQVVGDFTP